MRISSKTHIIWDLDGTLIDSFGIYAAVLSEASKLRGLPVPDERTLKHNFHGSLYESIQSAFALVDGANFDVLMDDFLRLQERYYHHPEEHVFADALSLLRRLHDSGANQVIITNRLHEGHGNASPRHLVAHSSLAPFISAVVCGDDVTARKPSRHVIDGLEAFQHVAAESVLVIGDQFVDAQLAQNLGCEVLLVNRGDEPLAHLEALGQATDFLTIVPTLQEVETVYA